MATVYAAAAEKGQGPSPPKQEFHLLPKIINGGIAAIIGVSIVFPIDLVKTRLQNQTIGPNGEKQYKNMIDCFKQTYRAEGYFGMYRGSLVNIILITPEKAIKLAANDLFRYHLTKPDGSLPISSQMLAGGMAGACQIVITTPMELLKIQMQDAGRLAAQAKAEGKTFVQQTTPQLVRKLMAERGFLGLYRGLGATALRDIVFNGVYFPLFFIANEGGPKTAKEGKTFVQQTTPQLVRKLMAERGFLGLYRGLGATALRDIVFNGVYFPLFFIANEGGPKTAKGEIPSWWSFVSGFFAGATTAIVVNPLDVVKTRLQTIAKGKTDRTYKGILDCFTTTYKHEGASAFMKGIGCRIMYLAPLFSIVQAVYYFGIAEYLLGMNK